MHTVPYGAWNSPITTDLIVGEVVALAEPGVDGGDIYWIKAGPQRRAAALSSGERRTAVQGDELVDL